MTARIVRKLAVGAALVCFARSMASAEKDPHAHAEEIRALVLENIDIDGPGIAVLVSQDGVPLHLAGYGLSDTDSSKPITPDSVFDLASISKQFTGAAIMSLAETGKVEPRRAVSDYLPEYRVASKGRAVTLVDLLHHVSGLADYTSDDWDGNDEEFAQLTPKSHLHWLNGIKPRRAPGVSYEYNNSEYALLALVVERVSGVTFAQYLRENLFLPAGMTQTVVLDGSTRLPAQAVKGYAKDNTGHLEASSQPTIMTGDGNVYTSLRDLARWDAALRNSTVISKKWQDRAWKNGHLDNGKPIKNDEGDGYGYGWVVEKTRHVVSHSGSWNGTSTFLLMNLENGLTVAILSNDENAEVEDLADEIAALFETE